MRSKLANPLLDPRAWWGFLRAWRAALALILALSASSCRTTEEPWSFSLTRSVYGGGAGPEYGYDANLHGDIDNQGAAVGLLVILLLPVAIDIVILPVTLTHDLYER